MLFFPSRATTVRHELRTFCRYQQKHNQPNIGEEGEGVKQHTNTRTRKIKVANYRNTRSSKINTLESETAAFWSCSAAGAGLWDSLSQLLALNWRRLLLLLLSFVAAALSFLSIEDESFLFGSVYCAGRRLYSSNITALLCWFRMSLLEVHTRCHEVLSVLYNANCNPSNEHDDAALTIAPRAGRRRTKNR